MSLFPVSYVIADILLILVCILVGSWFGYFLRKWRLGNTQRQFAPGQPTPSKNFFERATESHQEVRKLVITLSVGALAVFYATLISAGSSNAVIILDCFSQDLALLTVMSMVTSCAAGLLAWEFDVRWAYSVQTYGFQRGTSKGPLHLL